MFSLIIPIYNAEPYLEVTLNSVVQQEDQNFECVMVNDGSTDKSAVIAKEYAAKYSNFKYYEKPHSGLVPSLKYGVSVAANEYIGFLDADDKLLFGAAAHINYIIDTETPEAIECNYRSMKLLHFFIPGIGQPQSTLIQHLSPQQLENRKQEYYNGKFIALRWTKLMRKSLFNRIAEYYDDRLSYCEDTVFSLLFYTFVSDLVISPIAILEYVVHPNTMSTTLNDAARISVEVSEQILRNPLFYHEKYCERIIKREYEMLS